MSSKNLKLFFIALSIVVYCSTAVLAKSMSLRDDIHAANKRFLDAFNQCDIETMASMFTPDLEFYHVENGKSDCGTFKFTHVWRQTENGWQITRVISYGH